VVDRHPVAEDLGYTVGRTGMERRALTLGGLLHEAEHLGASGLIHAGLEPELADRVQQPQHAHGRDIRPVLRHLEGDLHMALGGEVVALLGPDQLQGTNEAVLVHEVAVVKDQLVPDPVDSPGVEGAAPAHQPVDLVPLLEEQLGEIAAVLPRDAGDERLLRCQGFLRCETLTLHLLREADQIAGANGHQPRIQRRGPQRTQRLKASSYLARCAFRASIVLDNKWGTKAHAAMAAQKGQGLYERQPIPDPPPPEPPISLPLCAPRGAGDPSSSTSV